MDEDGKEPRKLRPSAEKKPQWVRQGLEEEGGSVSCYERFTEIGTKMGLKGEALANFVTQAVQNEEELRLKREREEEELRIKREKEKRERGREEEELRILKLKSEEELRLLKERDEREKERDEWEKGERSG